MVILIEERVTPGISPSNVMQEHIDRYTFALGYVKGKRVLDAACGTGYGTRLLAQVADRVTGIDISPTAINHARKSYPVVALDFIEGDVLSLPFPDSSFDVVVSFETVEHIKEYQKFIKECRRVLTPNGILICSTPNSKISSPDGVVKNPYHVIEFDPIEFTDLLLKDFALVEMYGQNDVDPVKAAICGYIVKIKDLLGVNKRLIPRKKECSFPVSQFKDGMTKSAYMIAVCEGGKV